MYSTVILCGGKGFRMGSDKKALDWYGRPLLLHMLSGFSGSDDLFLAAGRSPSGVPKDIQYVEDEYFGCGPLAGLHAALGRAKHDILFVTSCDMPLVDHRTAEALLPLLDGHDAVVPETVCGKYHPLSAVYHRRAMDIVKDQLEHGNFKMRSLLDRLDIFPAPSSILPYGDLTLANLNTPDDVKYLKNRLEGCPSE